MGLVIGLAVQALKSNKFDSILARYNLPEIPPRVLPWVALVLGVAGGVCDALLAGETTAMGVVGRVFQGLLAGALPVVVHELGTNRQGV